MTFSRHILLCIIMLIAAACSSSDKAYQVAEREAVSPFELPAYDGIIDIMKGESFATIPAGKLVYVTDNHATGNDIEFVRVVWGDSTGYVRQDLILQTGKLAVITSAGTDIHEIHIYSDKELTREIGFLLASWTLAVAAPATGPTTEVLVQGEQGPLRGFYTSDDLHFDPVDIEFYNAYMKAEGKPAALYALSGDAHLNTSSLSQRLFGAGVQAGNALDERGDAETGEDFDQSQNEAEDANGAYPYDEEKVKAFETEQNWTSLQGVALEENEYPGTVNKYIVFTDGTEIAGEGHYLASGHAWENGAPGFDKDVQGVRFEIVPNKKCDISFSVETMSGYDKYDTSSSEEVADAEPGKPYYVFVTDIGMNTMVICSSMRVVIRAAGAEAALTMHAECGD